MAISPIDIANLALDKLGQPSIVTFQDESKAARLTNRMYPLAKDYVFRMFPWRRLRTRALIAASTEVPAWGYQFEFPLPVDLLRLLDVASGQLTSFTNGSSTMQSGWELEGNSILTNVQGPLQIRYIKDSDDPAQWDRLMVHTIAAYMAKDMAEALTQDHKKKLFAVQDFEQITEQARHANAQEGNPVRLNSPDDWETVRWTGGTDLTNRNISIPSS